MSEESAKQRIILAAGPIFARKGFKSATVREICDAANVNLASINYHFGDKHQLYIATVVQARQMRVQQVPHPKWEPGTPAEHKLEDFVRLLLQRMLAGQAAPWQVRLLMREILQPTEACQKLVEEYFRPFLESLMAIIDELIGQKLPQHRRMQLAFSIVGQCMYYRFAGDVAAMMIQQMPKSDQFEIDELTRHITEFSLAALKHLGSAQLDGAPLEDQHCQSPARREADAS